MGIRTERVEQQLKKEISKILQEDLKNPRVGFVTVTRVELTGNLRFARVYFSILGEKEAQGEAIEAIKSAAGFVRKLIGERMKLKYVPEILFKFDESIEYSINLEKTFERIHKEHERSAEGDTKR